MSEQEPRQIAYTFNRPAGWLMLPAVDRFDEPGWIDELVEPLGLAIAARMRLEADLEKEASLARAQNLPLRRRWVFLPDGDAGAVFAVMNLDLIHGSGINQASLLEGMRSAPAVEGASSWEDSYEAVELAGRPAVSGRQLLIVEAGDGEQYVNEVYRAAIVTPAQGTVMRVVISTPDIALFDDIVAYGDELVNGISFTPAVLPA